MSGRKTKEVRALAHHAEFGANYPAADRSRATLASLPLTPRQRRRADSMAVRKVRKAVDREIR